MTELRPERGLRNPVNAGCFLMAAIVALVVAVAVFAVVFLASGATGTSVVLDDARAYAPGSVEFVAARNLFIVRIEDSYYALPDLDAANRAAQGQRCRVQMVAANDPALPALVQRYAARMSDDAAGSTFLFRESCNNAVYDVTGVRLDRDGRNLDSHPVRINAEGRLAVNVARRVCTERQDAEVRAPVACE